MLLPLDIETCLDFGGSRESGLGTGFLKRPSWLVVENARLWTGARLFVCVDARGALPFGGAAAEALRLALEVVLVLSIEPDAACCLRLGILDLGTGSRDRGLGIAESLTAGGSWSIIP
jgi:hypothetical protein